MGCKDFNDQCAKVFPRVGLEPTSLLLASTALIEVLMRDRVIALIGQYEWSLYNVIQYLFNSQKSWLNLFK